MRHIIYNIFIYFVCDMFHYKFNFEYFLQYNKLLLSDCDFKFGVRGLKLKSAATSRRLGNHAAVGILFIVSAAQNDHLLSNLTMKTTSYSHQASCLITYIHMQTLGYKII